MESLNPDFHQEITPGRPMAPISQPEVQHPQPVVQQPAQPDPELVKRVLGVQQAKHSRYKIPILLALVVGLATIALKVETFWLSAILAFVGALIGVFILDLEYILQAYLVDPSSPVSLKIKEKVQTKNLREYIEYINAEEYNFGEMSIRSMLFQIVLAFFALYVVTTGAWIFIQALALSMYANLLYQQIIEYQKTGTLQRWFWIYNGDLNKNFFNSYMFVILMILVLQFVLL